MSDLQCAASFVLTPHGEADQAGALAESLAESLGRSSADRRIALVYTSDAPAALRTGELVADALGVPLRRRAGLNHARPDEESDADVVGRLGGELAQFADEHRGETTLVIGDQRALSLVLPSLARNVPATYADRRPLRPGGAAEMRVDADGWVLDSWMGEVPSG